MANAVRSGYYRVGIVGVVKLDEGVVRWRRRGERKDRGMRLTRLPVVVVVGFREGIACDVYGILLYIYTLQHTQWFLKCFARAGVRI